jgi:preprotein translocase subunit YajC
MPAAQLVLLAVMIGVMYFVLIRPQQKRLKEQQDLIAGVQPGDDVITSGGLHGTITEIDGNSLYIEVASGLELKFARDAISSKMVDPAIEAAEADLDAADSAD